MNTLRFVFRLGAIALLLFSLAGCKKIADLKDENPEIDPIKHGFKTSAAIGYCASLAVTVLEAGTVPPNVLFENADHGEYSNAGIMYVTTDEQYPLPFNDLIGDIVIAGIWNNNSGVITIVFGNLDIFNSVYKFYGIHTVPIMRDLRTGKIITVFAKQDIVIGEGSDTLLNLSFSNPQFSTELDRLGEEPPTDMFVAASQNVWFISIDQHNTSSIYDDTYIINGGGQIAEATSSSGGILYHALIGAEFNYEICSQNPLRGDGFMQNIKAGSSINLGNILLSFHDHCDGKAYCEFGTGEYLMYSGRNVNLNFTTTAEVPPEENHHLFD
jgi:hypothetical protein